MERKFSIDDLRSLIRPLKHEVKLRVLKLSLIESELELSKLGPMFNDACSNGNQYLIRLLEARCMHYKYRIVKFCRTPGFRNKALVAAYEEILPDMKLNVQEFLNNNNKMVSQETSEQTEVHGAYVSLQPEQDRLHDQLNVDTFSSTECGQNVIHTKNQGSQENPEKDEQEDESSQSLANISVESESLANIESFKQCVDRVHFMCTEVINSFEKLKLETDSLLMDLYAAKDLASAGRVIDPRTEQANGGEVNLELEVNTIVHPLTKDRDGECSQIVQGVANACTRRIRQSRSLLRSVRKCVFKNTSTHNGGSTQKFRRWTTYSIDL